MKNKILMLMMIAQVALGVGVKAQNVGINTSNLTPDGSAILDISSTVSGLLIPRMTTTQQNAIPATAGGTVAAPAIGLMLYNTSTNTINANIGTVAAPVWSSLWGTGGDNLINSSNQFFGTTTPVAVRFRTNNIDRMVVDSTTGYVGMGLVSTSTTVNTVTTTAGGIPNSTLQVNGSLATAVSSISAAGAINTSSNLVLATGSATTFTITLPSTLNITGRIYTIKNITAGTTVTLSGTPTTQTIDGASSYSLVSTSSPAVLLKFVTVQTDGTNWYIIANN